MWQDYAIAVVIAVFVLTLLPMIRARTDLPWLTIIPMLTGSWVLVGVYSTLGLWYSTGVEGLALICWGFMLAIKLGAFRADR